MRAGRGPVAGLPERGDVVDIDTEMDGHGGDWMGGGPSVPVIECSRPDSNREPRDYESPALTVELRSRELISF